MEQSTLSELVEIDVSEIEHSPLINEDIAPTTIAQRTWSTYNIAALWIGMSVCIPTYMLASGLIAGGMNWWQAILTIALGNVIVLIPMILNAHAGTKFGVPFPVLARASFGTLGSNVPALLRAIVACGWFGIQTWIGGQAINAMLAVLFPSWGTLSIGPWISFSIFWAMNVYFIVNGTESIRWLESLAAPFLLVVGLALLWWAYERGGGWGPILSQPSKFQTIGEFWKFFVPSLTGMVGFWATLSLNIPDFSRYAQSQRAQILGQAIGLPPTMTLYSFIGVAVTSATIIIFGEAIWDPVALLAKFNNPIIILLSMISLLVATLTTNIAANVVSPANDFSNLMPKKISFRTGGLITAFIGVIMMPWKLLSDYGTYIFGWLIGYSSFLGPIAGVLIADYFIIHKRKLNLKDLYLRNGEYEFTKGFNIKALIALGCGVILALIGLLVEELRFLYDYAWFVGFAVAFGVYAAIMKRN
ncbi:MAG: NCS1 family nucleobase:cation symporter-1 [Ignavibacteria bacterium]|nr:NCS1 family nucleobase:cation symporter-1 [Ignavibacteria bacterium]MBI3765109.1 NCS1 family nucleobase:cation symporter-1 [Ignavibacteriales bacterium]